MSENREEMLKRYPRSRDHFASENGVVIEDAGDDWARCGMVITEHHRNSLGGVMGGAIFTLADLAGGVAANRRYWPTVTLQANINFLNPTEGTKLIADAKCLRDGKTTCVVNVRVYDDLGQDIAQMVMTGYKLP